LSTDPTPDLQLSIKELHEQRQAIEHMIDVLEPSGQGVARLMIEFPEVQLHSFELLRNRHYSLLLGQQGSFIRAMFWNGADRGYAPDTRTTLRVLAKIGFEKDPLRPSEPAEPVLSVQTIKELYKSDTY
jgi:hypothetical protein